jgi:hypothetical protein
MVEKTSEEPEQEESGNTENGNDSQEETTNKEVEKVLVRDTKGNRYLIPMDVLEMYLVK